MNAAIIPREACFQAMMSGEADARAMAGEIVEETLRYLLSFTEEVDGTIGLKPEPLGTFSEIMRLSHPTEAVLALRAVAESLLLLRKDSALARTADRILKEMIPDLAEDGGLRIAPDGDPEYMRCPSVTLGGFPLHVERDADRMGASLDLRDRPGRKRTG